jgi:hypothetical protein
MAQPLSIVKGSGLAKLEAVDDRLFNRANHVYLLKPAAPLRCGKVRKEARRPGQAAKHVSKGGDEDDEDEDEDEEEEEEEEEEEALSVPQSPCPLLASPFDDSTMFRAVKWQGGECPTSPTAWQCNDDGHNLAIQIDDIVDERVEDGSVSVSSFLRRRAELLLPFG